MQSSQWRHDRRDGVANQLRLDCSLNRLFRRRSKKTSKLRVTGLCEGNSPVNGEFLSQRACNAENIFIWWRHHVTVALWTKIQPCIKTKWPPYTGRYFWMHFSSNCSSNIGGKSLTGDVEIVLQFVEYYAVTCIFRLKSWWNRLSVMERDSKFRLIFQFSLGKT